MNEANEIEKQELQTLRHSASHILAQAIKRLYPNTKLAIGPAIENGFYYDVDPETPFTEDVLPKLEAEMKKIVKRESRRSNALYSPRNRRLSL